MTINRSRRHMRTGQFFSRGGTEPSLPENFYDSARKKTAMLTCKITLPDSPYPVIIRKKSRISTLYLARQNEFRFFRLINAKEIFFSFLAAGFCPKNLAFARKIMALPESGGLQLPPPTSPTGSYAYAPRCRWYTRRITVFLFFSCCCYSHHYQHQHPYNYS